MKRWIAAVLALLVAISAWLDPYTYQLNASDLILPAPWWQWFVGLADGALAVGAAWALIGSRWRVALWLTTMSTLVALGRSLVFVQRDGLDRFVRGFGAEEYLSLFLIAIAIRVLIVAWIGAQLRPAEYVSEADQVASGA